MTFMSPEPQSQDVRESTSTHTQTSPHTHPPTAQYLHLLNYHISQKHNKQYQRIWQDITYNQPSILIQSLSVSGPGATDDK